MLPPEGRTGPSGFCGRTSGRRLCPPDRSSDQLLPSRRTAPKIPLVSLPVGLTFKGRFSRGQFWRYWLGALLGLVLLSLIGAGLSQLGLAARVVGRIIWVAGLLGAAWLSAATQVKRWHDLNRSGWMILIIFIPLVGFLASLICLGFLRGTPGTNRFGEPLTPGVASPVLPVGEAPPLIAEPPVMAVSGTAPGRSKAVRWLLGVGLGLVALVVLSGALFFREKMWPGVRRAPPR